MPMSAEVDGIVVLILVSVNRPVTSDGLMSKVIPFPLDVEIFVLNNCTPVPPEKVPPAPIAHAALVAVALKFPLLCAEQMAAIPVTAKNMNAVLILNSPSWSKTALMADRRSSWKTNRRCFPVENTLSVDSKTTDLRVIRAVWAGEL